MLFCLTANYTPKALDAMSKNPKNQPPRSSREATGPPQRQVGRHVRYYCRGPGAMAIFDIDPAVAPAVVGVAASSDGLHNVKMQRRSLGTK